MLLELVKRCLELRYVSKVGGKDVVNRNAQLKSVYEYAFKETRSGGEGERDTDVMANCRRGSPNTRCEDGFMVYTLSCVAVKRGESIAASVDP